MKVHVKPYGIAREILGGSQELEITGNHVADLRRALNASYPALSGLSSLMVAVNAQYASDETILKPTDEVVLIPPVSGG
jgi:molybdopterin synthase sulfur carrier subunit